ncbi:MAG: carboxylating nicotinate-nucleotide diphosphorylase [Candidatus Tritonobacter lacicola]|nr:carboxylating nicotinate-nucleotide diphosphorylase [Candidatus Tritonobacter lacicola]
MADLDMKKVAEVVAISLKEDAVSEDITTDSVVDENCEAIGEIETGRKGVLAGLDVAAEVFRQVDETLAVEKPAGDGEQVMPGRVVMRVEGRASSILKGERVALNLLSHLSGVATLTARFVEKAAAPNVDILDTRKTTPGLRLLEKYAVRMGGGVNHRLDLSDRILIKDNHLALQDGGRRERMGRAVSAAREKYPGVTIEVEAQDLDDVVDALEAGADIIMLDNMSPGELARAVEIVGGRARTEASGGVDLESVEKIAASGVDSMSIGALTHSAPALDFSMEIRPRE